jgi:serine/threonine protein kinase
MLNGRYEILGTIGFGATCRVDKARDTLIGRIVALKTFGHGFGSEELQKQFLREAQIVGRLSHRSIISLYDVGTNPEGSPYLVMEYVTGQTLENRMEEGRMPLPRIAVWAADLAGALARAHRAGIIHGDVKPANIMVTEEGEVKLGDFGIARFATQLSGSGQLMGTPAYLSPEQIHGHPQDTRSDLFSLGVILYQMATGVRPFDGSSVAAVCAQIITHDPPPPSHYNPELPPVFDHIVMRCLAKDPAARYPNGDALGASLYPLARSKPPELPKKPWWARPALLRDFLLAAGVAALALASAPGVRYLRARALVSSASSAAEMAGVTIAPSNGVYLPVVSRPDMIAASIFGTTALPPSSSSSPADAADRAATNPVPPRIASSASGGRSHSKAAQRNSNRLLSAAASAQPVRAGLNESAGIPTAPLVTSPSLSAGHFAGLPSRGELEIDIASAVSDEIIAVYADQQLLATVPLAARAQAQPVPLKYPLASGPHEFRVALYRADRSLQSEKEGLAEIRGGEDNKLEIKVARHAWMLLKHATVLDVTWPGGAPMSAAQTRHSVPGSVVSASALP